MSLPDTAVPVLILILITRDMDLREQMPSADEGASELYSNAWSTTDETDETIYDNSTTRSVDSTLEDKTALADAFAAANSRRNEDFHKLFPQVPPTDHLIEEHGCALSKQILLHGRMYISIHHVSFYSNIFGWVTNVSVPMADIVSVEKRNAAWIIPNAIQISTAEDEYFFALFLWRDSAFDTIDKIRALERPRLDKLLSLSDEMFPPETIEPTLPAMDDARSAEEAFAQDESG